jgi:formylglycine-generating enzyme required for sulfatase activity
VENLEDNLEARISNINDSIGTDLSQYVENTHDIYTAGLFSALDTAETENLYDDSEIDAQTGMPYANIAVSFLFPNAAILPPPPPPHPPRPPENMVLLEGGSFYMGSPMDENERDESEVQRQIILKPFYIGKFEVTQLEYQEVMGKNPSYLKEPNLPVDTVTWYDAIEYCNKLSLKHYLIPAYKVTGPANNRVIFWDKDADGYRLPTEEEWEYACRAGTTTPFNTGINISRDKANYFARGTVNVGIYPPNAWGLYDMHGNVAEWCWNKYQGLDYTISENSVDSLEHRVVRGGSWLTMTMRMRSAFRDHADPLHKNQGIGFRIVRNEYSERS